MAVRKICVVVASRANYGRIKYFMRAVQESAALELQLIVGASVLLDRFGRAIDVILQDGFEPTRRLHYVVEGETLSTQAKSTGLGIIELASAFEDLKPDIVVTVADRFETMATAIAASYLNIPLAHVQGGEITGNIDDRVRHAITKLADLHFPSTTESANRLIRMGEDPDFIFNHGCPSIDVLRHMDLSLRSERLRQYKGVGSPIDWDRPYVLMLQHPVTTSYGKGFEQVSATLQALLQFPDVQKLVMWPNIDAGSDDVSKAIRMFREREHERRDFFYLKNLAPEDYAAVLNGAACAVGNSSSFIREGSFLGTPGVIVGDRQEGRERGGNVVEVDYSQPQIEDAIRRQIAHGRYDCEPIFGNGTAGERIANTLATVRCPSKKRHLL